MYQQLRRQRGESSLPRLKFRPGEVLLMAPLAQHGRDASLIADIIKTLLDCQNQEYDAFTPITMDLPAQRVTTHFSSIRINSLRK
jgi:Uma2 family endonuclease